MDAEFDYNHIKDVVRQEKRGIAEWIFDYAIRTDYYDVHGGGRDGEEIKIRHNYAENHQGASNTVTNDDLAAWWLEPGIGAPPKTYLPRWDFLGNGDVGYVHIFDDGTTASWTGWHLWGPSQWLNQYRDEFNVISNNLNPADPSYIVNGAGVQSEYHWIIKRE